MMPRPSTPGSLMTSTVKENKPAWCSPGRPQSTLLRTGKPLGEIKPGNRVPNVDGPVREGPVKAEKVPAGKKTPLKQDTPRTAKTKVKPASLSPQVAVVGVQNPAPVTVVVSSRPKITKAPVTDETPPRIRPLKKNPTALVTPTNKHIKPVSSFSTPKGSVTKGNNAGKGNSPKASTPTSRAREKSQATERTPSSRRVKERPRGASSGAAAAQETQKSGLKDKAQQPFSGSGWGSSGAAVRTRKASPTNGRAPVKHLFLSPGSKKNAKKEPVNVRKSIEHGIWIGSVPTRRRGTAAVNGDKREANSEMPPPAQPTNSPEIPKRGSREASGEGIRGYFGAGPMVAPEGMGFVRDRRKCKPRGTLMVGEEGLSMDSDSSGAVESSIQMPLPSVASVEWMMNNDPAAAGNLSKHSVSTSLSEFKIRENHARDSFPKDRASQELSSDGFLQQLRQSRHSCDVYFQHARRSQAFLQHLRQSQLSREGSLSHITTQSQSQSRCSGDGSVRNGAEQQPDLTDIDMEYEDITIDWRQGLPTESMEMTGARGSRDQDVGKSEELVRSSISFTSSWVPPSDDNRRLSGNGYAKSWYSKDSSWYGFSPITPEFHRNSQLPDGGSKAIDALVAGSVRRRIINDIAAASSDKVDTSSTSLAESMQLVTAGDSASSPSTRGSQGTSSSSFQFATRNSYTSGMEAIPQDTFMCQTSSPIQESLFGEDLLCQTASPIDDVNYGVACSIDCSVACSIDGSVACTVDGSVDGSWEERRGDEAVESEDEVEYASPINLDYFSADRRSSLSARCETGVIEMGITGEANMGARAARRTSISRTLEELMRHNFTL